MQGQGLWLVGEYDGLESRTIAPSGKEGAKVFEPFHVEEMRLIVHDESRRVTYREGKAPDVSGISMGDVIVVGVRVRDMFNGQPSFDGRSAAVVAASGL